MLRYGEVGLAAVVDGAICSAGFSLHFVSSVPWGYRANSQPVEIHGHIASTRTESETWEAEDRWTHAMVIWAKCRWLVAMPSLRLVAW